MLEKLQKGGGVIFNPKVYIADFGPLNWALSRFPFGKKFQYNFPKMRGGGRRPFGTFQKLNKHAMNH